MADPLEVSARSVVGSNHAGERRPESLGEHPLVPKIQQGRAPPTCEPARGPAESAEDHHSNQGRPAFAQAVVNSRYAQNQPADAPGKRQQPPWPARRLNTSASIATSAPGQQYSSPTATNTDEYTRC